MARVLPPGYADVALQLTHTLMARKAYLTFGVFPGAPEDPTAVALAVRDATCAPGSLMSGMDNNCVLTEVQVRIGQDGGEPTVGTNGTPQAGSNSLQGPPPNVALLVHKVTTRGGRRGRGRLFIPWCLDSESISENGIIESGAVDDRRTKLGTWLAELTAEEVPMVLLHNTGDTAPGDPNVVTLLQPQNLVATQRRRLGR